MKNFLKYNNENSFTCTVLMVYYTAKAYYMNPLLELPLGKGFADVVYLPKAGYRQTGPVVELKWNQSEEGATAQINGHNVCFGFHYLNYRADSESEKLDSFSQHVMIRA